MKKGERIRVWVTTRAHGTSFHVVYVCDSTLVYKEWWLPDAAARMRFGSRDGHSQAFDLALRPGRLLVRCSPESGIDIVNH